MRWSVIVLPSLLWLLNASEARFLRSHHSYDDSPETVNETLWRRVRVGGGDSGHTEAPKASNLFLVGDSNLKGGCSSKLAVIDNWLEEAVLLHEAAQTAISDYKTNKVLAVLISQFLGVKLTITPGNGGNTFGIDNMYVREWARAKGRISRVTEFLAGAGLRNPQKPSEAPRIFCSGEAAEYVDWGAIMKDANGKEIITKRDPNTHEPTEYLTLTTAYGSLADSGKGTAFWMSAYNGYTFQNTLKPPYEKKACGTEGSGSSRYATTATPFRPVLLSGDVEFGKANRHVLFCPKSFDPGTTEHDKHAYPSLAQAVSADNYPTGGGSSNDVPLDRIMPVSATLYHELYHLTDDGDTDDPFYELDAAIRESLKWNPDVRKNPESYAFFAMAAYMHLNPPSGHDPVCYLAGMPQKISAIPF